MSDLGKLKIESENFNITKIELKKVKLTGGIVGILSLFLLVFLFKFGSRFISNFDKNFYLNIIFLFLAGIIHVILHELIHAFTYILLCKGRFKDLKFGMIPSKFAAYCYMQKDVPLKKYRLIALMPLFILLPVGALLYFWVLPGPAASIFFAISITGPIFDIIYTFKLRKYPGHYLVRETKEQDHLFVIKTDEK
ncbi:DUF3267 domain-containing protein [Candidatus Dependentiae bacterium]|nr:DUF3267 domain-containing protein [Candidatus Dependentiae bacterium]